MAGIRVCWASARVELEFERLEWAASTLLRLGADVEVLAPAALRMRLAHVADRIDAAGCRIAHLWSAMHGAETTHVSSCPRSFQRQRLSPGKSLRY